MGWYNSSWTHRQKITVDATKVDEVFSLLPIYTSNLNIDFFNRAKAGAADVRITQADGTTEVARYVVAHDATGHTGLILANVLADVSISTNTDYYVYYGNTGASDYATSATYGRDAVFAEYEGAYLPGMTLSDLTGAGRDLTAVGTPGTAASGYEGITAADYNGTTQYHKYVGTLGVTSYPFTMEGCFRPDNTTVTGRPFSMGNSVGGSTTSIAGFIFYGGSGGDDKIYMSARGASSTLSNAVSSATYTGATDYYLAGARDSTTGDTFLHVNGAAATTETTTIAALSVDRLAIGALLQNTATNFYDGKVALALLSNSVRSADYIATMYNAWSTAGFFTAGAIETEDGVVTTTTSGAGLASRSTRTNDLGDGRWYKGAYWNVTLPDMTGNTVTGAELQLNLTGISGTGPTMSVYARAEADTGAWNSSSTHTTLDALSLGTAVLTGQVVSAGTGVKYFDITGDSGKGVLDFYADHPTGGDLTIALVDEGFSGTLTGASTELHVGNDDTSPTPGTVTFAIHSDATLWPRIAIAYTTGGGGGNTGSGAITLGAATVSGTGTEREDGSGTPTLGNVEVSGAGTQSITGAGAITLGAFDVDGSSSGVLNGSGAITLGSVSTSGVGAQSFSGSGAISLGAVSVSGSEIAEETTGWFLFQYAESDNSGEWDQPSFALSDDSSYASRPFTLLGGESGYLIIKQPSGIDIPDDAQITSIQYKIKRWVDGYLPSDKVFDLLIRPIKDGVPSGDNIAKVGAWPTSAETVEYNEDLMGLTWESNDFGSNFGLAISVLALGPTTVSANVVTVWGKINYTIPEPITGVGAIELGSISVGGGGDSNLLGYGSITLGNVEAKAAGNSDFCQCCIGYTMSTLLEIRKRLARESGHYELVADYDSGDYADNGMDEYIRGGARYLDDKFQYDKSEAWFYKKLMEGESLVTFQNNRIIKSVWVNQASGDRKKLKRLTLDEIREQYTKDTLAGETNGVPAYWTPAILGLAPEQYTEDAASFALEGLADYDLIMFGNHYPHKGIYVMPPCDDAYTVEVLAEWYSAELCDDEDVSFWSQYPEILCMAARREIEIHLHRNTTGAADFERPILEKLLDLYRNLIAEEVSGPPEDLVMNG